MFSFFKRKTPVIKEENKDFPNSTTVEVYPTDFEENNKNIDINSIPTTFDTNDNKLENDVSFNNTLELEKKLSWIDRLKHGLHKTRKQFKSLFGLVIIDENWLEQLEDALLLSDVGVNATKNLMEKLRSHIKKYQPTTIEIKSILKTYVIEMLKPLEKELETKHIPSAMMMIGVNGAGKTTSIGKLCKHFQANNQSVLLAAADTFRAAASEQLKAWGDRNSVHVIANSGDPAAVAYDAIQSGIAKNSNVILIDTAGRLPTQKHLLEELKKIKKVAEKSLEHELHEVILIIDGNTGQNALQQVKVFNETVKLTGLIVTKLDGSAKGGVIIAISQECPIPIYFIGVGETLEDLQKFNAEEFVDAIFDTV